MNKKKSLAIFDLDETLLCGDSSRLWTNYLWDRKIVQDPAFLALDSQMMKDYYAGKLNIEHYLFEHISYFNQFTVDMINHWVNDYIQTIIKPLLYPQGINIIAQYQQENIPVIIISATMSFLVHPIAKLLNIDASMGIDMQINNGYYNGKIEGIPTFREGKVTRLNHWKNENNINNNYIFFYTDSSNDLPLCYQADEVITVNADVLLAQIAINNGWKQLHWDLNQ
ncbi:HAD family hydrolase [Proteus hauseri]|uniref:HAD family hydrolase n=1 Tax=Proteus hauseri TaxID=183417 RepID=UPI00100967E9|nr:HAD-IB family hydrolase [Proteus hauseri]QAV22818.1 HAD-IB family hydrolase [Proteus hauseri]